MGRSNGGSLTSSVAGLSHDVKERTLSLSRGGQAVEARDRLARAGTRLRSEHYTGEAIKKKLRFRGVSFWHMRRWLFECARKRAHMNARPVPFSGERLIRADGLRIMDLSHSDFKDDTG